MQIISTQITDKKQERTFANDFDRFFLVKFISNIEHVQS